MNNAKLSDLRPNPEQPRHVFDVPALLELAQSIRANGVIQPVVVEQNGHGYIIHDGERRWRASCALAVAQHKSSFDDTVLSEKITQVINGDLAKFLNINEPLLSETTIPVAITTEVTGSRIDRLVRATVANLQRADLTEVETARAYQAMADTGMTDSDIASACGKSRSTVANARRLLKLPDYLLQAIESGYCSARTAQAALPALDIKSHEITKMFDHNPNFSQWTSKYNPPTPTALFKRLSDPKHGSALTSEAVREIVQNMKAEIAPEPCPDCGKNIKGKTFPEADRWIDNIRYCGECKEKRIAAHNERLKTVMVARYCPRCGEKNFISEWYIAGKHLKQCCNCNVVLDADKFQTAQPQMFQADSPYAVHPCPKCGEKRILINPRANVVSCEDCGSEWNISGFHNAVDDKNAEVDQLIKSRADVGTPTPEPEKKKLEYYNPIASKLTDRINRLIRSVSDPDDMALLERRLDDICTEFFEMMAGRS